MHARPVSIALVAVSLTIAPVAAMSEIYKWVEADGSVHYGDAPPRTKNARLVGRDSGTVSVVPGMSKEEKDRLREREDQLRLQRLEREVEELRAREQAREYAQPEVVYTDVYVPTGTGDRGMVAILVTSSRARNIRLPNQGRLSGRSHRRAKRRSYTDRSPKPALGGGRERSDSGQLQPDGFGNKPL